MLRLWPPGAPAIRPMSHLPDAALARLRDVLAILWPDLVPVPPSQPPAMTRPPYTVRAWYSWRDVGAGRRAIDATYQTRAEAIAAGRASDCPLVDVIERGRGVIAERCTLMHPQYSEPSQWAPRRFYIVR